MDDVMVFFLDCGWLRGCFGRLQPAGAKNSDVVPYQTFNHTTALVTARAARSAVCRRVTRGSVRSPLMTPLHS